MKELEKYEIFFGDVGLTSTSANHTANMAKEYYQSYEKQLNSISLHETTVNLIGTENYNTIQAETPHDTFNHITDLLTVTYKCKALIAWLREAIKARKLLYDTVSKIDLIRYCEMIGEKYPEMQYPEAKLTEDGYIATLSIKDRNKYIELETICATIGSYIHQDGAFSKAREKMKDILLHPTKYDANGRDTIFTDNSSTYSTVEIDDKFFELQNIHRESQAQLNKMKFDMESAVSASAREYQAQLSKNTLEYNQKMTELNNSRQSWLIAELTRIGELKIVIPDSLKETYDMINKLGK